MENMLPRAMIEHSLSTVNSFSVEKAAYSVRLMHSRKAVPAIRQLWL